MCAFMRTLISLLYISQLSTSFKLTILTIYQKLAMVKQILDIFSNKLILQACTEQLIK
jgi:hypothetical protein